MGKTFTITSPEGKEYKINAPDGATQEDAEAYMMSEEFQSSVGNSSNIPDSGADSGTDYFAHLLGMVNQGLSFGASDEIEAVVTSLPALLPGGESYGEAYDKKHQALSAGRKQFGRENPKASTAAEITGGLATGGAGAAKIMGAKALSGLAPLVRTAIAGGIEGGAYGGLSADQGERLEGVAKGTALGAALAPATQLGMDAVGKAAKPIIKRFKEGATSSPDKDAVRYLSDILSREGISDPKALVPKGKEGLTTLADVSTSARGALEGVMAEVDSPKAKNLVTKAISSRNAKQQSRAFEYLDDGLGISTNANFKDITEKLKTLRADESGPLYDLARSKPIRQTKYLRAIFHPEKGLPEAQDALKSANRKMEIKRALGEPVTSVDVVNEVKRSMYDQISALYRTGEKHAAIGLTKVKNRMVDEIDSQIPEYKEARNIYAGKSALLDAGEQGKGLFKMDVDEIDDLITNFGDSEKVMYRLGVRKAIREKLMGAREGLNSVNRIMSEMNLEKIKKAFPTDKAFNKFKADMKFEADIYDTTNVLRNSLTSLRDASKKDMQSAGIGEFNRIGHDTAGLIAQGLHRILNKGLSAEAKESLGQILIKPISELDDELVKKLNKTVLMQTPKAARKETSELMSTIFGGLKQTAPVAPVIGATALMNE